MKLRWQVQARTLSRAADQDRELEDWLTQAFEHKRRGRDAEDGAPEARQSPLGDFEARLDAARARGGTRLPDALRSFMEQRFEQDFGAVRVHNDAVADELAEEVRARAFTVGHDVFFRDGAFQPGTDTGRELLAHELTHVLQQDAGLRSVSNGGGGTSPGGEGLVQRRAETPASSHASSALEPISTPKPATETTPGAAETPSDVEATDDRAEAEHDAADTEQLAQNPPSMEGVEERAEAAAAPQKEHADAVHEAIETASEEKQAEKEEQEKPQGGAEGATEAAEEEPAEAEAAPAEVAPEAEAEPPAAGEAQPPEAEGVAEPEVPEADPKAEADALEVRMAEAAGDSGDAAEAEAPDEAAEPEPEAELAELEAEAELAQPAPAAELETARVATPEAPTPAATEPSTSTAAVEPEAESAEPPEATPAVEQEPVEASEAIAGEPAEAPAEPEPEEQLEAAGGAVGGELEAAPAAKPEPEGPSLEASEAAAGAAAEEVSEEAASDELLPAEREVALSALAEGAIPGGEPSGGGGGGGPGGAAEAEAAPEPPDVSAMKPEQAMGTIANLPPVALQKSLGGVTSAVANDVGQRRDDLAQSPPSMERPTGAPLDKSEAAAAVPKGPPLPSAPDATSIDAVPPGANVPTPAAKPLPDAAPPAISKVQRPNVAGDQSGNVSADDASRLQANLRSLPASDPALEVSAGPAPTLVLEGNADPARMVEQHQELRDKLADARSKGAQEAAEPLGEDEIFPDVPEETLKGTVTGGGKAAAPAGGAGAGAAPAGGGGAGGELDDNALSKITEEEHGAEIDAAVGKAQTDIGATESEHETSVSDIEAQRTQEIADAEQANAEEQSAARRDVQDQVRDQRSEWTAGQETSLREADEKASGRVGEEAAKIRDQQQTANDQAAEEIDKGETKAKAEADKGAREANQAKQQGQQESGGFFGLLASAAKALFDRVKAGIQRALAAARAAVKAAIETAKKAAVALIEKGRQFAIAAIRGAGDFLIGLGDIALDAFPGLRDKFRNGIESLVAAGEATVNELADDLKEGVTALLDAWAADIDAALGLLEKGLLAVVDIAAKAVDGAIQAAKKAAEALGGFMALINDIASDPIGWLKKLGAAAASGIKDHLWSAFKAAVKEWFNSKIEGLVSVGKTVWALLTGQLGLAEIGRLAFDAIKAAIPPALIRILIEKLVALIVPAAGAILAIVEGLQAAWGTVSRILAAMEKFIAFLKAVKTGAAAPLFAQLVASAAIVVLDFVANFLLAKLGSAIKAFAGKLMGIAQRLLKKKAAKKGKETKQKKARTKRPSARPKARRTKTARPKRRAAGAGSKRRTKDQRKKDKKLQDTTRRVNAAMRAADARFAQGVPEDRAAGVVGEIARRFRVTPIATAGAASWTIGFHGSRPTKTRTKRNQNPAESAAKTVATAKSTDSAGERAAAQGVAASKGKAPSLPNAKDATEKSKQIGAENVTKGEKFERQVERLIRRLEEGGPGGPKLPKDVPEDFAELLKPGQGGDVITTPRLDPHSPDKRPGGFDTVIIRDGKIIIIEAKSGRVKAFGAQDQLKGDELDDVRKVGTTLSKETMEDPSFREDVLEGKTIVSKSNREIEVKVSAITTNLERNLKRLLEQLTGALTSTEAAHRKAQKAKDPKSAANLKQQIAKLEENIAVVKAALAGQAKIQVILATPEGVSDNQLQVIEALFTDAVRNLGGKVDPEPIRVALIRNGKIVGGR